MMMIMKKTTSVLYVWILFKLEMLSLGPDTPWNVNMSFTRTASDHGCKESGRTTAPLVVIESLLKSRGILKRVIVVGRNRKKEIQM